MGLDNGENSLCYTFRVISYDDWHQHGRVMEFEEIQYIAFFSPTFRV